MTRAPLPKNSRGCTLWRTTPSARLIPEKLVQLDNLLSTIPGCECRVAPNETLYIINLTADEAAAVLDATADGAKTLFETSVACIGASICQQGVRDSQSVLQRAVQAVREANIPDGALPKVCISGCTSSCSGHQAAAIGFQGTVKAVPGGKPAPGVCHLPGRVRCFGPCPLWRYHRHRI